MIRLSVSSGLFLAALLIPVFPISLALYLAALLIAGCRVFISAVQNMGKGQLFDENLLMSIAAAGAFAIGEYPEAVAVMLFYGIGELFQDSAAARSRRSIAALLELRPDSAELLLDDGRTISRPPESIRPGQLILIRPGQRVPLDGIAEAGCSDVDSSALTGESLPRQVQPGDAVFSGSIVLNGELKVRVSKAYGESTVSRILRLVEDSAAKKSRSEAFIRKFARIYTPVVVGMAALVALLPPLLIPDQLFSQWLYRGLMFLVVSCPCALVISVPLSFFAGLGAASRKGILIKGSNYIETLAKAKTAVFDKTGTLTEGVFHIEQVCAADGLSREDLLYYASAAESISLHPLAKALNQAVPSPAEARITDGRELAGLGVSATVDGHEVLAGSEKLLREKGVVCPEEHRGSTVFLAIDGSYAGHIIMADSVKKDTEAALKDLKQAGINKTVMLSGDSRAVAEAIGEKLGIDRAYAELMPDDKVAQVESLLAEKREGSLLFIGDGINDAPALARADLGIAMGALGADAAIEAADVVIMKDSLMPLAEGIKLARRTMRIVKENIIFSLGVKGAVLTLSAAGITDMWLAVIADVGVAMLAVLNALRQR